MTVTETSDVEANVKEAQFAFLIIKQKDGRLAVANVNNAETERQPTLDEIHGAVSQLQRDLDRQALAMAVLAGFQQMNQSTGQSSGLVLPEKRFVKRGH